MNAGGRRGFSLVELTIVVVLGTLVLSAVHRVLVTNLRAYTLVKSQVRSHETVRTGSQVLFAELRELSPRSGDLLRMDDDSMTVRSASTFGIVCSVDLTAVPKMTVRRFGRWIEPNDSIFVLADNDPVRASDDFWHSAQVSAVDTTVTCGGGDQAQEITLPGVKPELLADSVLPGAPVRTFTHYEYTLSAMDGSWYLSRAAPSSSAEPLVGPLGSPAAGGLRFEYLDSLGAATVTATDVAQFRITMGSAPGAAVPGEAPRADTIVTTVYARN